MAKRKRTLFELDDSTGAGERRKLGVVVPHGVDVEITANGQMIPLFPHEAKQLAEALLAHYFALHPPVQVK